MDSNYIYIYILLVFSIGKLASCKNIEKNQRIDNEDVKYLAFVTNGDLYSCPCVIISERHLLASGSCIRRHERGLEIIAGVVPHTYDVNDIDNDDERAMRKISKIKYHDQYVNQVRSIRIHNSFVVLTLTDSLPIGNNIKIAKLPTKDVEINDEATIHGWYQTCTIRSPPRFINAPLTVVDSSNCSRIDKDEFCVSSEMTEKIIHSSPVIVNGTIIGYTTFGCPSLNNDHTVTSVYYYLSFIKNAMKPFI
ncbi:uncharacterized protein LOC123262480 [Cotesia glomerata]|uniref:uncharacterized protein LOC123262480 n=1 Tax=Cotesia glomerata TaxID=32391 RepID=UPI001D022BEF|nr:uncharacterized protein LOC123262480 [Cotesia glomerata]